MKALLAKLMSTWKLLILPALAKLGFWGVGLIALIDSSSLPVPMDALLAVYVWNNKGQLWLFVLLAAAGSAVGGLVPYGLGYAGGEIFLLKRVDRDKFENLRKRFEKQEFLAVMIPSMLPPPTPWKLFVFAAGVFEMRVIPFVLAVFCGRIIRWTILSLLVLKLGPTALPAVGTAVKDHLGVVLVLVELLFGALGIWAFMRRRKNRARSKPSTGPENLNGAINPEVNSKNS